MPFAVLTHHLPRDGDTRAPAGAGPGPGRPGPRRRSPRRSTSSRSYSLTWVIRPRADRGSCPTASGARRRRRTCAGTSTTSSGSRKPRLAPLRVLTMTSPGLRPVRPVDHLQRDALVAAGRRPPAGSGRAVGGTPARAWASLVLALGVGAHVGVAAHAHQRRVGGPGVVHVARARTPPRSRPAARSSAAARRRPGWPRPGDGRHVPLRARRSSRRTRSVSRRACGPGRDRRRRTRWSNRCQLLVPVQQRADPLLAVHGGRRRSSPGGSGRRRRRRPRSRPAPRNAARRSSAPAGGVAHPDRPHRWRAARAPG